MREIRMPDNKGQNIFLGLVCMLGGMICIYLAWIVKETHKDYSKRWIVVLFGLLLLVTSFQFFKEFIRSKLSPTLDELLNSLARTAIYAGFGILTVSALISGDSKISGGLPFLPDNVNSGFGKAFFWLMGISLCGVGLYCLAQTFAHLRKYIVSKSG